MSPCDLNPLLQLTDGGLKTSRAGCRKVIDFKCLTHHVNGLTLLHTRTESRLDRCSANQQYFSFPLLTDIIGARATPTSEQLCRYSTVLRRFVHKRESRLGYYIHPFSPTSTAELRSTLTGEGGSSAGQRSVSLIVAVESSHTRLPVVVRVSRSVANNFASSPRNKEGGEVRYQQEALNFLLPGLTC